MFRFMFTVIAMISISACIAVAEDKVVNGATIRGEVLELTQDHKPIEGVEVKLIGSNEKEYRTLTDKNGEYKFTGLPGGRYTINVSKKGYGDRVGRSKVVAADGEIFDRIKMRKRDDFETLFTVGALQHVVESIGRRYKLDTSTVQELNKSVQIALNTFMKQTNQELNDFAEVEQYASLGFIIALLTHPDFKATFAKYLTKTQLQDYTNFLIERKHKNHQTIIQFISAFLCQELSLTINQRQNLMKLVMDKLGNQNKLSLMRIMDNPVQKGVVNLIHNELDLSLDSILSQTQAKIWWEWVNRKYNVRDIVEVEVIDLNEPDENENRHRIEVENQSNITKSKKWIMAEDTLRTHTNLLGPLNEDASKRLEVVTKGVIQQYIEMEKTEIKDNFRFIMDIEHLLQDYMHKNITREQAIKQLDTMKEDIWGKPDTDRQWDGRQLHNLTNHPLYQQTIKNVLSEDAYLQYMKSQFAREKFRIRAAQNLIVSLFDMFLLLNDKQLKQFKLTAQQLTIPYLRSGSEGLQIMSTELLIKIDQDILTPWQISVFKRGR